jgi:hypothetical protein
MLLFLEKHYPARCWWPTPVILATQEAEIMRTSVKGQCDQKKGRLYLKNIPQKKKGSAGGVTQVVDHVPSKCEALSPNPNTAKKN